MSAFRSNLIGPERVFPAIVTAEEDALHVALKALDAVDKLRTDVNAKIDDVNAKFDDINARFSEINEKFNTLLSAVGEASR